MTPGRRRPAAPPITPSTGNRPSDLFPTASIESETARFLTFHTPAGHERFYRAAADHAAERTLPPPSTPDITRVHAAGEKHGVEFLGPPPVDAPDH